MTLYRTISGRITRALTPAVPQLVQEESLSATDKPMDMIIPPLRSTLTVIFRAASAAREASQVRPNDAATGTSGRGGTYLGGCMQPATRSRTATGVMGVISFMVWLFQSPLIGEWIAPRRDATSSMMPRIARARHCTLVLARARRQHGTAGESGRSRRPRQVPGAQPARAAA